MKIGNKNRRKRWKPRINLVCVCVCKRMKTVKLCFLLVKKVFDFSSGMEKRYGAETDRNKNQWISYYRSRWTLTRGPNMLNQRKIYFLRSALRFFAQAEKWTAVLVPSKQKQVVSIFMNLMCRFVTHNSSKNIPERSFMFIIFTFPLQKGKLKPLFCCCWNVLFLMSLKISHVLVKYSASPFLASFEGEGYIVPTSPNLLSGILLEDSIKWNFVWLFLVAFQQAHNSSWTKKTESKRESTCLSARK